MDVTDHFGVANLLGHPAFEHLASAHQNYTEIRSRGLFDPAPHKWPACLGLGGSLEILRRKELKSCIQAVILFQAMMEKIPYFVPDIGSGLQSIGGDKFRPNWDNLLSQISGSSERAEAKKAFNEYHTHFYSAFRNPIIHGQKSSDVQQVNKIRLPDVYEGMRLGWRAYDYLLTAAFAPEQIHEPSWNVMCNAHHLPSSLNTADYPDIDDLGRQFRKKHLEEARKVAST